MNEALIHIGPQDVLMVVDVEREFAEKNGALYVGGIAGEVSTKGMISNVKILLRMPFARVVPTKDMHPANHIEYETYGMHCLMGTRGCEIVPLIARILSIHPAVYYTLHKGHDSRLIGYSIVFSQDFPLFVEDLRRHNFRRIFFCGLAYDKCVGESAIDCARQGFEVYVIRDATRSVSPPNNSSDEMDRKLELYGVKVIYMKDLAL